jgi:hypothetical protein
VPFFASSLPLAFGSAFGSTFTGGASFFFSSFLPSFFLTSGSSPAVTPRFFASALNFLSSILRLAAFKS